MLDYARMLAAEVERLQPGLAVRVVVPKARALEEPSRDIAAGSIYVLQVSNYGYHKRGVPLWLLAWMRDAKRRGATIGCIFHELYAFGAPWNSSFWLSPIQRYLTVEFVRLADFWMVNRTASAEWLLRRSRPKPYAVLPIVSNIGEMTTSGTSDRRSIVVFGGADLRVAAYIAAGDELFDLASHLGGEIHDIGSAIANRDLLELHQKHSVRMHGRLPASAVGALLSEALIGLVLYPVDFLGKSSVFAAYCAHGVCPIVVGQTTTDNLDGLLPGTHYLRWSDAAHCRPERFRAVGRAAFEWYQPHDINRHASELLRLIDKVTHR